jgi:hypothetical protein
MQKWTPRRLPVLLSAVVAALLWVVSGTSGTVTAARQGVHITPNGFRMPIYGMSLVKDASGAVGTSCGHLTTPQMETMRFGRTMSRSMLRIRPQALVDTGAGVKFEIIYSDPEGFGFNDAAEGATRRRALEAAAAAWSRVLRGTVTIRINALMEESEEDEEGSTLLAAAGPVDFWLIDNTAIPSSLAWQIQRSRNEDAEVDLEVTVNPDINWEYATNGVAGRDKVSFVYTLLHEIAHGLGFIDSFDPETGVILNDPVPFVYDRFVNRGSDRRRLVMDRPDFEALDDLISNDLFFNGPAAVEASGKSIKPLPMIRLYAPDPYEPGSSIAHVDQDTYADLRTGLMAPRDFGNGTDKIDTLTLSIMKDMGYQLVPNAVTTRVK